eukprot:6860118-Prymnesium_polylepis.1
MACCTSLAGVSISQGAAPPSGPFGDAGGHNRMACLSLTPLSRWPQSSQTHALRSSNVVHAVASNLLLCVTASVSTVTFTHPGSFPSVRSFCCFLLFGLGAAPAAPASPSAVLQLGVEEAVGEQRRDYDHQSDRRDREGRQQPLGRILIVGWRARRRREERLDEQLRRRGRHVQRVVEIECQIRRKQRDALALHFAAFSPAPVVEDARDHP